jgi:hypothetical protein
MDDPRVLINAKYEERVRIKHLSMEPSLQGAKATFDFERHRAEIVLPTLPANTKAQPGNSHVEAEGDGWKDGKLINISIYYISVGLLDLQFDLPAPAASQRRINMVLFTTDEASELDKRTAKLYIIGRRALEYFLRVARWKTGSLIAVDTRPDRATLFGGRLFNLSHGDAFYSSPIDRIVVLPKHHRLKVPEWKDIEAALAAGTRPPLWNEYLMSAQQRIENDDLPAAIVDLAIAAESAIRSILGLQLPNDTPKWTRYAVGRINISTLTDRWVEYNLPAISHLPWFSTIRTLFQRRNELMHRGDNERVRALFCKDAASAVQKLITALETVHVSS